jgi:hypothetical protein
MNGFGKIAVFFLGVALATGGCTAAHAVTPGIVENAPQHGSGDVSDHVKIRKVTGVIKKMDSDTLLLENNRKYSLKGVKVIDLSGGAEKGKVTANQKLAEMTFINNRLTEVVLR